MGSRCSAMRAEGRRNLLCPTSINRRAWHVAVVRRAQVRFRDLGHGSVLKSRRLRRRSVVAWQPYLGCAGRGYTDGGGMTLVRATSVAGGAFTLTVIDGLPLLTGLVALLGFLLVLLGSHHRSAHLVAMISAIRDPSCSHARGRCAMRQRPELAADERCRCWEQGPTCFDVRLRP